MSDSNDDLIRKMKEARDKAQAILPLNVGANLALIREPILSLLRDSKVAGLVSRVDEFYVPGGVGCLCVVEDQPLFVVHHTGAADERGIGIIEVWKASPDGSPLGSSLGKREYNVETTPKRQLDQQQELRKFITHWIAERKPPDKL